VGQILLLHALNLPFLASAHFYERHLARQQLSVEVRKLFNLCGGNHFSLSTAV